MGRLRKIGVAAERDAPKPRVATQPLRLIEPLRRAFRRRAVPASVDQEERFLRVGQRHHERVIAPHAGVRDVHPFLALARGFDQRPVCVDDGLIEKLEGLRAPDAHPRLVDGRLQRLNRRLVKPPAEIARGRRVGDPLRP
jgi:hypothetical protein